MNWKCIITITGVTQATSVLCCISLDVILTVRCPTGQHSLIFVKDSVWFCVPQATASSSLTYVRRSTLFYEYALPCPHLYYILCDAVPSGHKPVFRNYAVAWICETTFYMFKFGVTHKRQRGEKISSKGCHFSPNCLKGAFGTGFMGVFLLFLGFLFFCI